MAIRDYVRRHHVGLLALLLILTGGTAYAAKPKVHLPKNVVASKQVKNGSLTGADLRDGAVGGADVGDGSLTGGDVADGSLTAADLAAGSVGAAALTATAVPIVRIIAATDVSGGANTTVFSDPAVGAISFGCGPGPTDVVLNASLPPSAQPGAVRVVGHDLIDNNPVTASTASTATVQVSPIGASFVGTATLPEGNIFINGARKRLSFDWDVDGCVIRGLLVIQDKVANPDLP